MINFYINQFLSYFILKKKYKLIIILLIIIPQIDLFSLNFYLISHYQSKIKTKFFYLYYGFINQIFKLVKIYQFLILLKNFQLNHYQLQNYILSKDFLLKIYILYKIYSKIIVQFIYQVHFQIQKYLLNMKKSLILNHNMHHQFYFYFLISY